MVESPQPPESPKPEKGRERLRHALLGAPRDVTDPKTFEDVKAGLEKAGLKPESAELAQVPSTYVKLDGAAAESVLKFVSALEDHDDVQNVYANFDIDPELMEKLSV